MRAEGMKVGEIKVTYSLDLRYFGQSFTLNVPWVKNCASSIAAFHEAHHARYGHCLDEPVELVNLRVGLRGPVPRLKLEAAGESQRSQRPGRATLFGVAGAVPVWPRAMLECDQTLAGPALITETVATTYLEPGWQCRKDRVGNLVLSRMLA